MDSNIQRRIMTPGEYARTLKKIMDSQHLSIFGAATKLGISPARVVEMLKEGKQVTQDECQCPMLRGGGIDHHPGCAYIAAKKGYKVIEPIVLTPGVRTKVPIDTLRAGPTLRASYDPVCFQTLKKSIKQIGQTIPILVTKDGTIIDGLARYRAMIELGMAEIWVEVAF